MDKNQIKLVHHKANDIYKEYNDEDSIPETYRDISNIPNRMFKICQEQSTDVKYNGDIDTCVVFLTL